MVGCPQKKKPSDWLEGTLKTRVPLPRDTQIRWPLWLLIATLFATVLILPVQGTEILPFKRAIYGPWNYSQDAKAGLDADYDNSWWTTGPDKVLSKFARNSQAAHEHNITYVAGLYYLGYTPHFDYVRAVNQYGQTETWTPSKIDPTYWRKLIEEPAVAIANLSLYYPIWGVTWDFEHYLANNFHYSDYSFDQEAMEMFSNETGISIPNLSAGERYPYLRAHGLLQHFEDWQREKVYQMARDTERKAHAINPNLSLGILGFGDSWFLWTILAGSNSSTAPVTAWTEDTYGGYDEGRISFYKDQFRQRHLYGKILPGLYTVALNPWKMITNMERATRHNGVFWIYQHDGNQYRLADEKTYSLAYQLFNKYFFFNSSSAHPLPSFTIYPKIYARPYKGPSGVTLLLQSHHFSTSVSSIEVLTDSPSLTYVGENLTAKTIAGGAIRTSNLPCFLYGLSIHDLERTEVWSMIQELEDIVSTYSALGFPPMTDEQQALQTAKNKFASGSLQEAKNILENATDRAFEKSLSEISPLLDRAAASPRESPIPVSVLGKLFTARRIILEGEVENGRLYLLAGMKEWAESIPERLLPLVLLPLLVVSASSLLENKGRGKKKQ